MKKACEALIAEYVFHTSDEREKLRHSIISRPEAICSWIQFNLDNRDWKDCISAENESVKNDPNFFDNIDFEKVISELKTLLGIHS